MDHWYKSPSRDFLDLDPEPIVRALLNGHGVGWPPALDYMVRLDPRLRVFGRALQVLSLALAGEAVKWTDVELVSWASSLTADFQV
jgi:hypothetical protein